MWLSLVLLMTQVSCADMGEGEGENAFYQYFSHVYLISPSGRSIQSIARFNESISMDGSTEIKEVVGAKDYCYIAFWVAPGWTLTVDEFAFFFKGADNGQLDDGNAVPARPMILDFYISDTLPTKIRFDGEEKNDYLYLPVPSEMDTVGEVDGVYTPDTDSSGAAVERPDEVDESVFDSPGYARSLVNVTNDWDSVLLSFDTPQVVKGGQFIVVRINNNCHFDGDPPAPAGAQTGDAATSSTLENVKFTFNYLMFHFRSAQKS